MTTKPVQRYTKLESFFKPLKLDYISSGITDKNFPDDGRRGKVEILHFNKIISSEDAIVEMKKQGMRPATLQEVLLWAKNWNRKDSIVSLGALWANPDGGRYVPVLSEWRRGRLLHLYWFEYVWNAHYRFAAVREPLDSGKLGASKSLESRILELEKFKARVEGKI
jgi:hypothetical protein